jgi:hypothetical protein
MGIGKMIKTGSKAGFFVITVTLYLFHIDSFAKSIYHGNGTNDHTGF